MAAITDLFEECTKQYASNAYLWEKKGDSYQSLTYSETRDKVYLFACGLMSLGVQKGDRIALLAEGCSNWMISELGMLYAGAVNVPLSVNLTEPGDIKFRLVHAGVRMVVVSANQSKKLNGLLNELDSLEKVIVYDLSESTHHKQISFDQVMELGKRFLEDNRLDFEKRWTSVSPSDYANICYTSGTTADPKGIILSHRNYTANVAQGLSLMSIPPHYTLLLILPWDHAFAHTVGTYIMMQCGASIASVQAGKTNLDTLKNIPANLKEIRPHFLLSVPAIAKSFRKIIEQGIRNKGWLTNALFTLSIHSAYLYNGLGFNKGKGWRKVFHPLVIISDKLIFSKIRDVFGGRLEFFVGGGALLDIELQRFFYAIGIPMFQGYGLTEASPIISSNSPQRHKLGSSGFLVSNMELKICDEDGSELPAGNKGEIVIRGENVMVGYWNNPTATSETIKDGWLYTGDIGMMDKEGFLYVYGRFKSLLIGDDGEKFSPEGIEEAIVEHSGYIDQCMLYNNQNPYTIALIVIRKEAIHNWLQHHSTHSQNQAMAILLLLESEFKKFQHQNLHTKQFPARWLPTVVAILPEGFTQENQFLNSTMKMVRGKICEKYESVIKTLYKAEAKSVVNAYNLKVLNEIGF